MDVPGPRGMIVYPLFQGLTGQVFPCSLYNDLIGDAYTHHPPITGI